MQQVALIAVYGAGVMVIVYGLVMAVISLGRSVQQHLKGVQQ